MRSMKIAPLLFAMVYGLVHAAEVDEFSIPARSVQAFAQSFQSALK
jgi:hypothetical protein